MGKKVIIVVWLMAFALASFHFAEAQQPAKVAKIGWLLNTSAAASRPGPGRELFMGELHELSYVEGKNIAFEYRSAENNLDRLPALADELVRLKVDVITMSTMSAALAAKNVTRTIPI